MPQMAPINWLSLFFMMCATFLMFNIINYFMVEMNIYKNSTSNNKNNINNNNFMWKW